MAFVICRLKWSDGYADVEMCESNQIRAGEHDWHFEIEQVNPGEFCYEWTEPA